jgi:hypothetical protein
MFVVTVADGLCCAWFISYIVLVLVSGDRAQLSSCHLKTRRISGVAVIPNIFIVRFEVLTGVPSSGMLHYGKHPTILYFQFL